MAERRIPRIKQALQPGMVEKGGRNDTTRIAKRPPPPPKMKAHDYETEPVTVYPLVVNCSLRYRPHVSDDTRRRYFVGSFQIGFAKWKGEGWVLYRVSSDHAENLAETYFEDSVAMHEFLLKELVG